MRLFAVLLIVFGCFTAAFAVENVDVVWRHDYDGGKNAAIAGLAANRSGSAVLMFSKEVPNVGERVDVPREHVFHRFDKNGAETATGTLFRLTDLVITRLIMNDEGGYTAAGRKRTRSADPYHSWIGVFDRDFRLLRTVSLDMGADDRVNDIVHSADSGYAVAGSTMHPRDRVRTSWIALLRADLHRRGTTLFPAATGNAPVTVIPLPLGGQLLVGTRANEVHLSALDDNLLLKRQQSFRIEAPATAVYAFADVDGAITVFVNTANDRAEPVVEALVISRNWELVRRVRMDASRISKAASAARAEDGGFILGGSVMREDVRHWAMIGLTPDLTHYWHIDDGKKGYESEAEAVDATWNGAAGAMVMRKVLSDRQVANGEKPDTTVSVIRITRPKEVPSETESEEAAPPETPEWLEEPVLDNATGQGE